MGPKKLLWFNFKVIKTNLRVAVLKIDFLNLLGHFKRPLAMLTISVPISMLKFMVIERKLGVGLEPRV